jgi:hypothetical protein
MMMWGILKKLLQCWRIGLLYLLCILLCNNELSHILQSSSQFYELISRSNFCWNLNITIFWVTHNSQFFLCEEAVWSNLNKKKYEMRKTTTTFVIIISFFCRSWILQWITRIASIKQAKRETLHNFQRTLFVISSVVSATWRRTNSGNYDSIKKRLSCWCIAKNDIFFF